MDKSDWADTNALANVATGLGIYSMIPYFFGMVDNNIGCIPWMLGGLIFVIVAVVGNYRSGDEVSGTANAILTGICLFGNLWHALIDLLTIDNPLPANVMLSLTMGDGAADLGAAFFCGAVAALAWGANKAQSVAVVFPTVAFFLLFLQIMGIAGPFGHAPMICFTIFGTWLIYSGVAMLFHHVTGKQVLPYIIK